MLNDSSIQLALVLILAFVIILSNVNSFQSLMF
jgi:hypothetical protein